MGGGNFTEEAPPNSYIDVNDFPTIKSLAEYLKYLLENKVCTCTVTKTYTDNYTYTCGKKDWTISSLWSKTL